MVEVAVSQPLPFELHEDEWLKLDFIIGDFGNGKFCEFRETYTRANIMPTSFQAQFAQIGPPGGDGRVARNAWRAA